MTPQDYEAYQKVWPKWVKDSHRQFNWIVACSPNPEQLEMLRRIFPHAKVSPMWRGDWDLSREMIKPVDLVVACNVFHYSEEPEVWFENVFASCREFWIQDLIRRRRGNRTELGSDGDQLRFCWRGGFADSNLYAKFDLSMIEGRMLDFFVYDAGSFEAKSPCINFMARFKGDIA